MKIPPLQIGNITVPLPIIQGGMGVRISLAGLAAAVANEGGIGTIASVGLGDVEASKADFEKASREALIRRDPKSPQPDQGPDRHQRSGRFEQRQGSHPHRREGRASSSSSPALRFPSGFRKWWGTWALNLIPIISSGRAADLVLRTWDKRYQLTADAVVLEGPLAGGHLGFSIEQLAEPEKYELSMLLPEVLQAVEPFEEKYGRKIPVIAGGGIFTGTDIARMLQAGAAGVQMATRFVCTLECDASPEFKQAYLDAKEEDIVIIKSPVGLPGRAIRNPFLRKLERGGKEKIKCFYRCLSTCDVANARYCIAQALVSAYQGNMEKGLVFCGQNAYRVDKIVTVQELIAELKAEIEAY